MYDTQLWSVALVCADPPAQNAPHGPIESDSRSVSTSEWDTHQNGQDIAPDNLQSICHLS
jgi:hypothetical protein